MPTGRLAKSTLSIIEKLRRESIRLSQMQDIAGCRVVVPTVVDQDRLVANLATDFPKATILDRREKPSHGYRAVHVVAGTGGQPIEIQVRSALQHLWAEFSEKSSDVLDPTIKYGGGPKVWQSVLDETSQVLAKCEALESRVSSGAPNLNSARALLAAPDILPADHEILARELERAERTNRENDLKLQELRRSYNNMLTNWIEFLNGLKRHHP